MRRSWSKEKKRKKKKWEIHTYVGDTYEFG
jgi:hypothetical protein